MTRITRTGQDNWTARPPQTDADRQHAHGPLQPADVQDEIRDALWLAVLVPGVLFAAVVAAVALGWLG